MDGEARSRDVLVHGGDVHDRTTLAHLLRGGLREEEGRTYVDGEVWSNSSTVVSKNGLAIATPALFTSASMRPSPRSSRSRALLRSVDVDEVAVNPDDVVVAVLPAKLVRTAFVPSCRVAERVAVGKKPPRDRQADAGVFAPVTSAVFVRRCHASAASRAKPVAARRGRSSLDPRCW